MKNHISKRIKFPNRMGKHRFLIVNITVLLSIAILLYQTIEYLNNSCGCGENIPEIMMTFREYSAILGIPISAIGVIGMSALLGNVIGISYLSKDYNFSLRGRVISIGEQKTRIWVLILKAQLIIMTLIVLNLLLLEVAIINYICYYCTISQAVILINTIVLLNWNPFSSDVN